MVREQILEDIKTAMKSGDTVRRDALRMLNSTLKQIEVDERITLSDERVFSVLQTEIKRRNESAAQYKAGGREDLAQKELGEAEIIGAYLPKQLSDDELSAALSALLGELSATSAKDMGRVMKAAKEKFGASVDGKRLSEAVKSALN
ncbi:MULTISPECIES: GatB/YqeY domain-containing protein [unclassified Campylobacter]|uniref:GatB/YqeY domain-containing protein n=1 Tax=unclassified Campylobacter TaxID=2593542 RepID=UPI0022E9E5C3|nr:MULTISPECIES: GatB/YqeY domain-containing protein [unclassified Campylobacter]MDA3043528.1 GatB/YqeY domain-containing protein [Campylobacter sp. JMF_09 ED2]MDA3044075.1 GatB/YqeY domain-containing protein [Campylobacter sp. JMF_07 ED4]MDA3063426.1 GatB/YqeY domain-containing protein [Campylobacter sp. JMF_11 EL3]MDA3071050.1 GatB/YqeY domain-containing protein [Campylobacter sp. VBCF_03 NA9]MDA3074510.1 GatB/YqeY domain-containing protein [Campylobacter sp. JMF_05 ED3]